MRLQAEHVDAFFGFLVRLTVAAAIVAGLAYCTSSEAQVITWHDANGNPVQVVISQEDCPNAPGRGCAMSAVFLGRNAKRTPHELAHTAGMRHTPWRKSSFGDECATVTVAGYATGYEVGDTICAGFDGSDAIWKLTR